MSEQVVENNLDTKINLCIEGEYLEDIDNEMSNINNYVWEISCLLYTSILILFPSINFCFRNHIFKISIT